MSLDENNLEKRFRSISRSQGSIQSLSIFCLHYKTQPKKIVNVWLRTLQKTEAPLRLTLIYLANDIVQNARRKNLPAFIDEFKSVLKQTGTYLRDERIKKSVERVFDIWRDRHIYDAKFVAELKRSLNSNGLENGSSSDGEKSSSTKLVHSDKPQTLSGYESKVPSRLDRLRSIADQLDDLNQDLLTQSNEDEEETGDENNDSPALHKDEYPTEIPDMSAEIEITSRIKELVITLMSNQSRYVEMLKHESTSRRPY